MFQEIKRDFKQNYDSLVLQAVLAPVGFIFGFGLLMIIMVTDETATSWFPLGTTMALGLSIMFPLVFGFGYHQQFMLALSMGQTRKGFMTAYALRQLVGTTLAYLLVLGLYHVETAACTRLFPQLENEISFLFLTRWWVPALIPVLVLVGMFVGSIYSRFGRNGWFIFYFLWSGGCILAPRVLEVEPGAADGFSLAVLSVGRFLSRVPGGAWAVLAAMLVLGMLVTVLQIGRKQLVH